MIFNPLDEFYKSQTGAVCENKEITFRVKGDFDSVVFVLRKDGESSQTRLQMIRSDKDFQIEVKFEVGLYFYCFDVDGKFIGLNAKYEGEITDNPVWFQLTVYSSQYKVPEWLYGGIIYQIFPDRFYRAEKEKTISSDKVLHENWRDMPVYTPNKQGKIINNDFFGGDLKGIIEKLGYLCELGVTAIYLNPIFKAFSNHRYDTGDYMTIDSLLGTEKDFISLINKAEEFGIKIILDGVFNHTGDDSVYFNKYGKYQSLGAYQSDDSKYSNWYKFGETKDEYESWWGITTLPSVNKNEQSYLDFITGKDGVLEHYTKLGIGGWRLDVVDELSDDFVKRIRKAVKGINDNATVIGEVWEDASNKISYDVRREYFQGAELDSVMNYPLKNAIITFVKNADVKDLSYVIKEQIDHYPNAVLNSLMNILSTHDTIRLITAIGGIDMSGKSKIEMANTYIDNVKLEEAKFRVKVASLLQYTFCGVPSVYYGDEIGMQGYIDPLNRRTYDWGNEDKELLDWYKFLGVIRKEYDAFTDGKYEEIYANDGAFVYKRTSKDSEVMVAVNLNKNVLKLSFDGNLYSILNEKEYVDLIEIKSNSFDLLIKK